MCSGLAFAFVTGCSTSPIANVISAESLEQTYDQLSSDGANLFGKECVLKSAMEMAERDAGREVVAENLELPRNATNRDGSAYALRAGSLSVALPSEYYVKVASAKCEETAEQNVGS
jgi:hypothetical protein